MSQSAKHCAVQYSSPALKRGWRWIGYASVFLLCGATHAQSATGTAFMVAPELLLTNRHVVEGCASLVVFTPTGKRPAVVHATDAQVDLAAIRVTDLSGPQVRFRVVKNPRLGEAVMVFGFPLSGSLSSGGNFTSGLVSGLRGLRDAPGELQVTAPVQPGNSGGPSLDSAGLVIGVVKAKLDAMRTARAIGDIPQNVNFAIGLQPVLDFLARHQIAFSESPPLPAIEPSAVADAAQGYTYRMECVGRQNGLSAGAVPPAGASASPPAVMPPAAAGTQPGGAPSPAGAAAGAPVGLSAGASGSGSARSPRSGPMAACQGPAPSWSDCIGAVSLPDGARYVGEFKDGKYSGLGTYQFFDGRRYVGELKDGKRSGQGIFTLPDGIKYVGEYKDDKLNGVGAIFSSSGQLLQSGLFEDNRLVRPK